MTSGFVSNADQAPPRALVVDDDRLLCDALRRHSGEHGIEIIVAHNIAEGFRTIYQLSPCVLVIDLAMPGGGGEDLIEALTCNPNTKRVPVIVMTGLSQDEATARIQSLPVAHVLYKPVGYLELLDAIMDVAGLTTARHTE
jgi:DNA-binding response OmpR family regulator